MRIEIENWSLTQLIEQKDTINPKPQYQRTSVWQPPKKKLLIDSILRGYDIPKFYLRETPLDPIFNYEITDGQQRMRSIWEFVENSFTLDEANLNGFKTKGLDYDKLITDNEKLTYFLNYEITVAIIKEADLDEIRSLFARLQMGSSLNPAELRHALASNLGNVISSLIENHSFFKPECKIPNIRYKHQDYLDNALALSLYDANRNIKAVDMKHLYIEYANKNIVDMQPMLQIVNSILDFMLKINSYKKGIFKNKWAFVDVFYLLYKQFENIINVNPRVFADNFWNFEMLRKKHNSRPEILIDDKTSLIYDKDLYDYIVAFNTSGADKNNAKIRYRVLYNKFFNKLNFDLLP